MRIRILALCMTLIVSVTLVACASPATTPTVAQQKSTTHPISHQINIYSRDIMEVGGDGEPIKLVNNPDAVNPTYAELIAFIKQDRTDEYSYIFGPPRVAYICSDFAEDVHNNAEAAGIRAAWVGIDIEGETEGHALNAFETTDLGLVFIDCTGKGLWDETTSNSWDRRARVEIGKEYSVEQIDKAKAQFRFFIGVYGYSEDIMNAGRVNNPLPPRDELGKLKYTIHDVNNWELTHDIQTLGQRWIQEWIQEYATELSKCGKELKPDIYQDGSHCIGWRINVDCLEVTWFKPLAEVIDVDGMPVRWEMSWGTWHLLWFEPLGVVKDIHIHW
jgi:hypothetical protein